MAIAAVITRGIGSFGSIGEIVTAGLLPNTSIITGTASFGADPAEFSALGVTTIQGTAGFQGQSAQFSALGVSTIQGSASFQADDAEFNALGTTVITGTATFEAQAALFSARDGIDPFRQIIITLPITDDEILID